MVDRDCQPLYRSDTWEIWKEPAGKYVFSVPNQKPVRHAVISADFSDGDVIIDPSTVKTPYITHSSIWISGSSLPGWEQKGILCFTPQGL